MVAKLTQAVSSSIKLSSWLVEINHDLKLIFIFILKLQFSVEFRNANWLPLLSLKVHIGLIPTTWVLGIARGCVSECETTRFGIWPEI